MGKRDNGVTAWIVTDTLINVGALITLLPGVYLTIMI